MRYECIIRLTSRLLGHFLPPPPKNQQLAFETVQYLFVACLFFLNDMGARTTKSYCFTLQAELEALKICAENTVSKASFFALLSPPCSDDEVMCLEWQRFAEHLFHLAVVCMVHWLYVDGNLGVLTHFFSCLLFFLLRCRQAMTMEAKRQRRAKEKHDA